MNLTRSQFSSAVRADEKWVENTARTLGQQLTYTPAEARRMGMVRVLATEIAIPITRAAELANDALRHPPEMRALPLSTSTEDVATLVVDLARYHSTFAAALSAALNHGGPRRRGRPAARKRTRGRGAVAAAEAYGVDVSLLREALERTPAERLARLDANSAFLGALRRVSSAPTHATRSRARKRR